MPRILIGARSDSLSAATLCLRSLAALSRSKMALSGPSCFCTASRVATMTRTSVLATSCTSACAWPTSAASPKYSPSPKVGPSLAFGSPLLTVPLWTMCSVGIAPPALAMTVPAAYFCWVITLAMWRFSARLSACRSGIDVSACTLNCSRLISISAPTCRTNASCVIRIRLVGSDAVAVTDGCVEPSPASAPSPKLPPVTSLVGLAPSLAPCVTSSIAPVSTM
mmetsp:Transcript_62273/g.165227  ORF Transcript_62273/g.165227 Transcript_62273/m.165227 type:complete len:223 (-) Transcript_62273:1042-1710(-)